MKHYHDSILILSSAGMILSCFYACTSFILACISRKPISVPEVAAVLFLATVITYIHHRRGWRRMYTAGLHILGWLFASVHVCHSYYNLESPFWGLRWIPEFFGLERTAEGWLVLILILLCVWIVWFCGIRLLIKPTDQTTIGHRFDLGLAFLLLLLLIKLLIAVKGGSIPVQHSSTMPLLSFIIFGLLSMGLVRTASASETVRISYLKGAGVAMTFIFIILLLGVGLFLAFSPELQTIADMTSGRLGGLKRPVEQILIALSHFFLGSGIRREFGGEPTGQLLPAVSRSGGEFGILHYLFIGVAVTILSVMTGFILYCLLKWFFSKIRWFIAESVKEKPKKSIWELLLSFMLAAKRVLSALRVKMFQNPDISYTVEKYYKLLLRWGRFSGLSHVVCETPKEYEMRLTSRFPRIEREIRLIIHMHDEAVYGNILPDRYQVSRAKIALRRIRHPLFWFDRIKSLFSHDHIIQETL